MTDNHQENISRIYRSRDNKVFAGVLGGLGEFFNVDPVLLRLGYVFIFVFTGFIPAIVAYILAVIIMPKHPDH